MQSVLQESVYMSKIIKPSVSKSFLHYDFNQVIKVKFV